MAFSLSDRISSGRIRADSGSGWRSNAADYNMALGVPDRGSVGAEQNPSMSDGQPQMAGQPSGNPHSASGFRRALMKTERTQGRLAGDIASRNDFGGKGFRKPNYFAQGGKRHGMHMGSGAPVTTPAMDTGTET
jgi:hypothetical protein